MNIFTPTYFGVNNNNNKKVHFLLLSSYRAGFLVGYV